MINQSVLLIDADKALRYFLRKLLSQQHYKVIEAATAEEGLSLALKMKPDFIILELELPDSDGLELLYKLLRFLNAAIFVLSNLHQEAQKIAALDAGADAYMTKPFSEGELLARLRAAQRKRSWASLASRNIWE
jgi:two-component system, OmpR family, KDP operon response regulator KdpE